MTALCMDESVFVYDSIVRRVWARKGNKPRIMTTGSHKKIFEFGSVALDGTTLFRSYESMNSRVFISFLNTLKREYGRFIMFYDGAPWHTSGDVEKFLEKNRKKIIPVRFPKCSPQLNPAEECWNQAKGDLLGSSVPENFGRMKKMISNYFRKKKFKLNIINYLCP
ncbi:MAG: transposase [Thermoplasmatales archaeon]|nr:transposase [Thermoplasmatales archaeon]